MRTDEVSRRLHSEVAAVCPIHGVTIGVMGDSDSVIVDYHPAATAAERAAAEVVVDEFDWSEEAQEAWEDEQNPNRADLRSKATQAIQQIEAYLALASPTQAQVVAEVKLLSQSTRQILLRLVEID